MIRIYSVLLTFLSVFLLLSACQPGGDGTGKTVQEIPQHLLTYENLTVYDIDAVPAAAMRIEKIAQYPSDENIHLAQIHAIDVDGEGNVYIADIGDGFAGIHVFSPDGSYFGKTGRDGSGPGEFRNLMDIHISGDSLFAFDLSMNRIQIFSLPDRNLADIVMFDARMLIDAFHPIVYPFQIIAALDKSILISFVSSDYTVDSLMLRRFNFDGEFEQKNILKIRHAEWLSAPEVQTNIQAFFLSRGFMQMTDDNHIIAADGKEILMKEFNGDGIYQRAFYHPFRNRTLDSSEILEMYGPLGEFTSMYQRIFNYNALPRFEPAFDAMLVDDEDRIWISTIVDDREEREWRVMDRSGILQSKFRWPAGREIKKIAKGNIYALDSDPDTFEVTAGRYQFFLEK